MGDLFRFISHILILCLAVALTGYYYRTKEKDEARRDFYERVPRVYAAAMHWAENNSFEKMSEEEQDLGFAKFFDYAIEHDTAYHRLTKEEKQQIRQTAFWAASVQGELNAEKSRQIAPELSSKQLLKLAMKLDVSGEDQLNNSAIHRDS